MVNSGRRGRRQKRSERRQEIREKVKERFVAALSEEPEQQGRARLRKAWLNRFKQRLAFQKERLEARRERVNEIEKLVNSVKTKSKKVTRKDAAKKST